jgi:hypothetical protein
LCRAAVVPVLSPVVPAALVERLTQTLEEIPGGHSFGDGVEPGWGESDRKDRVVGIDPGGDAIDCGQTVPGEESDRR